MPYQWRQGGHFGRGINGNSKKIYKRIKRNHTGIMIVSITIITIISA